MNMQNGQEQNDRLEAPPKLVAALKGLSRESVFVPPTIDESLITAARQQLSRGEKKKTSWFNVLPWTVAATGLAAAVLVGYPYARDFLGLGGRRFERSTKTARSSETPNETGIQAHHPGFTSHREDLNRDGEVDILDAFMLARKLQNPPLSDSNLDINGDGFIDHRDVDTIAAHAVSLEKRGRS